MARRNNLDLLLLFLIDFSRVTSIILVSMHFSAIFSFVTAMLNQFICY